MVTHDLDSLYSICDRIAALADGKVVPRAHFDVLASSHPWVCAYFHGKRRVLRVHLWPGAPGRMVRRRRIGRGMRETAWPAKGERARGLERQARSDGNPCELRLIGIYPVVAVALVLSIGFGAEKPGGRKTYKIIFTGSISGSQITASFSLMGSGWARSARSLCCYKIPPKSTR
jgi:hypothetical protein